MSFHLCTSETRRFLSQTLALTETSASFNGKDDFNSPTLSTESTCTADLSIEVTEIAIRTLDTTIKEAANTSGIVSEDAPASPSLAVHIQDENQKIENNCTDDCNPWPHIKNFFECIGSKIDGKNNSEYKCLLCQPLSKILSFSVTSMTNLKKLIHWSHPTSVAKFQTCIDNYKMTRKRKKTEESEYNPVKRKMLQTLVTDN